MTKMKFYIADAFAEELFGGNPAGVVILPDGKDFPTDEAMRKTAAELRYSETAFIKRLADSSFNIRYFTPADEVELCGHATIASFICLLDAGLVTAGSCCKNKTLAGDLEIKVEHGFTMMEMADPKHMGVINEEAALKELYEIMGIEYGPIFAQCADIRETGANRLHSYCTLQQTSSNAQHIGCCSDTRQTNMPDSKQNSAVGGTALLPMIISTGLPDIIMPVASKEALVALSPDFKKLAELSQRYGVVGVHAFALGTTNTEAPSADRSSAEATAYCRNFAPLYEIDEEAATGTSNGALTYYLYKNRLIANDCDCTFVQGEAMGRPSKIFSHLHINEDMAGKGVSDGDDNVIADKKIGDGNDNVIADKKINVGNDNAIADKNSGTEALTASSAASDVDKPALVDYSIIGDTTIACTSKPCQVAIQVGGSAVILAKGEIYL